MIQYFVIHNFKSIKDTLILDFSKGSIPIQPIYPTVQVKQGQQKIKINRLNFIYGKNGAGKSTIRDALQVFKSIAIAQPANHQKNLEKVVPFKLVQAINPHTFFGIQFIQNKKVYRYSLLIDTYQTAILDEKLEFYENKSYHVIYEKDENIYQDLTNIELERLQTFYLERESILSVLFHHLKVQSPQLQQWIGDTINFFNRLKFSFDTILNKEVLKHLYHNPQLQKNIEQSINQFDLSISHLSIQPQVLDPLHYLKQKGIQLSKQEDNHFLDLLENSLNIDKTHYHLQLIHNGYPLLYDEESSGTQVLLNRLYSMHFHDDAIWIIDDFENDLHEEAASELIKYFGQNFLNQQFVLITHRLSTLDIEEIKHKSLHNFIEKDLQTLATDLVNLSEYGDLRKDKRNSWKNFYKHGRIGQYPKISINKK